MKKPLFIIGMIIALSPPLCGQAENKAGEVEETGKKEQEQGPLATDATSTKLIALHNKARGGLEKIKAINTLKMKGLLREGKNYYNMLWYRKAPNKYRVEKYYRKLGKEYRVVMAYDGTRAWSREVSPEKKLPKVMGKGDAKAFIEEADFYGPLVDWERKGHHFAYLREAKVYSKPAYLVKAKLSGGPVVYYYFDTRNFLVYRFGFTENLGGAKVGTDYYVPKFKKVNDVWMEVKREYSADNQVYKTIEYNTIQANLEIPDELFAMPRIKEYWLKSSPN